MSKTYLVTGGTGFIGSALVKRLLNEGHRVKVLDNNSRGAMRRITDVADDIELIVGDIRDVNCVTSASKGCDSILHLAAVNGTEFFYSEPELVLDVAVRGMLAVVDACRANDIGDVVIASSSEAYQSPSIIPTPENVPLVVPDVSNHRYSYGGGKILSELVAMNYSQNGFDRMAVFRPHNVYGSDMGWEHVIPQFALRANQVCSAQSEGMIEFPILGDGTQTRAFVHIDDFTDGLMTIVDKGLHREIYHIGNMEEVTIAELAANVVQCFDREVKIIPSEAPKGETNRRCPDIAKLRALGFSPSISLSEGLQDVVAWYAENADLANTKNRVL